MKKLARRTSAVVVTVVFSLTVAVYLTLLGSLPILNGSVASYGLSSVVNVERDRSGIPTVKAQNRVDAAQALGFIHGQERFFQMDLLRRSAAGELAELFGEAALPYDRKRRNHRFRDRASTIIAQLPQSDRAILKAYVAGVNQGFDKLHSKPYEYFLINQKPKPWRIEDSLLVVFTMYLELQYGQGRPERMLAFLNDTYGPEQVEFLFAKGSQWDSAIDGSQYPFTPPKDLSKLVWQPKSTDKNLLAHSSHYFHDDAMPGSNNWAVSGKLSEHGGAMVADDMHLGITVPNTWFRASLSYQADNKDVTVTGITLPGAPLIIIGSNGKIAWGFTNSNGDWSDVILLETNDAQTHYMTEQGWQAFDIYPENIVSADGKDELKMVKQTIWGPVIGEDHNGVLMAYRWVAYDKEAINLNLMAMEQAGSVNEAMGIAAETGMPAQNLMVADDQGNIGWTIIGPLPVKKEFNHKLPQYWHLGQAGWNGYLAAEDYPKVINPDHGRLWTANSRVVGGEEIKKLGNGGYALGVRAQQIEELLFAQDKFDENALLQIQLDDRANLLTRWHGFLSSKVLISDELSAELSEVKRSLADWNGHAAIDSVSYSVVRQFRLKIREWLFAALEQQSKTETGLTLADIRHKLEIPMWYLINEQPNEFLPKPFETWQQLFESALLEVKQNLETEYGSLDNATWGTLNSAHIQHPISKAIPALGMLLDMPVTPMPGDNYMPRIQAYNFGASQRMVVSPGKEEQGIMHMPTSQSGNPLSPYFGKGHRDWIEGTSSPFLPGTTKYQLTLSPAS